MSARSIPIGSVGKEDATTKKRPWWSWPLLIVLLPVIVATLLLWLISALLLLAVVWLTWCPRRRYAIVVYSNSPVWSAYFEKQVIPRLGERAVVLNWSERKRLITFCPNLLMEYSSVFPMPSYLIIGMLYAMLGNSCARADTLLSWMPNFRPVF